MRFIAELFFAANRVAVNAEHFGLVRGRRISVRVSKNIF
jgi:hypothetical protein